MEKLYLTSLPPGVRFKPTEEEIIQDYLSPKVNGSDQGTSDFIHEVTFFKEDPWKLKGSTGIKTTRDPEEWFFFSKLDPKYRNGNRSNRKTKTGYWKGTGGESKIWSEGRLIGKRKILVFHTGQSPSGKKTDWVVYEYHATELDGNNHPRQETIVLCNLFRKSNNGSKFGPSKSKLARASVSPASEEEADNHVTRCYPSKTNNCRKGRTGNSSEAGPSKPNQAKIKRNSINKKSVFNNAGSAVSFPTTSKSRLKETKSKLGCFDTEDSDIAVAGGDNNVNFVAAENQVTDIGVDQEMEEVRNICSGLVRDPLDGNSLNFLPPLPKIQYTAINRVEEETTGEVVDSNMFRVLPDSNMFLVPPDLNVFCVPPALLGLSPLHSQMQSVCMSYCVANDSNYLGADLPFE